MKTSENDVWQGRALRTLFALKYVLGKERAQAWLSRLNRSLVDSFQEHLAKSGPGDVRPVATERSISLSDFRKNYQSTAWS